MRDRLLGVAEVGAWVTASFTIFLALRVASIFISLVNAAQCTDSCNAGSDAIPIALFTYGLAWCPFVLVAFVRTAKRGPERWWVPHAVVVAVAHAVAMLIVLRTFSGYTDSDTRTVILAGSGAAFDVLTLGLLLVGSNLEIAEV